MGILSGIAAKFVGGSAVSIAKGVADIVDTFVETEEEKKAAEIIKKKIDQKPHLAQSKINEIQAGHRSIFVAGPRPFIMWVCGSGLAMHFIVFPLIKWAVVLMGSTAVLPDINTEGLVSITLALLGLAGMRSWEKKQGLTG